MIPKILHLCWLSGDPYPEKIEKCLSTWKKHLPNYEIMVWDTKRFDVNSTLWTKQAFEAGKYAFVADYIRFYAVYNYGGIYLDSDVEVLKSFDSLLSLPYFIGNESNEIDLEAAVFGAEKHSAWVKCCMDYYTDRPFVLADGTLDTLVCPKMMANVLDKRYTRVKISSVADFDCSDSKICVFPMDWFCAHIAGSPDNPSGLTVTRNTYSVHHFAHRWATEFPGGPLHRLFYKITGRDWHSRYFDKFGLVQENNL